MENRFLGVAQIDSSSLEFPRGGEEGATGVYNPIHDCCERRSQQSGKPKCEESIILRVAMPSPVPKAFDYLLPEDSRLKITKGMRVIAPFGSRQLCGMVIELTDKSTIDPKKLKTVTRVIDTESLWDEKLLQLVLWLSDYYHYPIGETIMNALPKLLREGKPASIAKELDDSVSTKQAVEELTFSLNGEQQFAVSEITKVSDFQVFLLEGITGSGKTEVYLHAISNVIKQGKQALFLVPEIGLTPQTVGRFQKRFGENAIAVMHSRLTDRERLDTWVKAKTAKVQIVIGTRSAIFLPFANLGLIVIDEEHDKSFKQHSSLRYSARDVATMRGKLENIPVVLGSATPALESIHNVKKQIFRHLVLSNRVGSAGNPTLHVIDLRSQKVEHGISAQLKKEIENHLAQNSQVLVFINRRGYAPVLICPKCGWIAECSRCDARLTVHLRPSYLQCHYCGITRAVDSVCPACKHDNLTNLGVGTERLAENIKLLFPEVEVVRIDRDTTRKKNDFRQLLAKVDEQKSLILVGTQMIAKGHHFPNVTLVAIVNADHSLLSVDFRAEENLAQLVMQVAGRAGREEKPGKVYIQTYNPEHPLLLKLIRDGYHQFALDVLAERSVAKLPPFSYFAILASEAKLASKAESFLSQCKELLITEAKDFATHISEPVFAPMQKKAGFYRLHILFSNQNRQALHKTLRKLEERVAAMKVPSGVRWSIDVDPVEI